MDNLADAVPASVRALMQLLGGELATVRFPDVDGARLDAAAHEVAAAARAVAEAEAALETARRKLGDQQEALLARARRAFGYLRVFADGDTALEAKLEAIALPPRGRVLAVAAGGEPLARRRGRPPKSDKGAPLLAAVRGDEPTVARAQAAEA